MVHNEWRGTYDQFEEAVELGDLDAFLRIDPNVLPASSVSSQPKKYVQSTTLDVNPGPTKKAPFSAPGNERRVLQDEDDILSFLPQGTTVTDAEVDALLKELEKPLPRTTKRSYTPSNRARNDPLTLPSMPKDRPQAPSEPTKYDANAMLSRNLVSEAAKAIGVSPTPRKFAPRMRLNKRSTEEIMKERRARMEQAENNHKNDELFDTLGLSDMKISEEEAEAFLTKGIIPTPKKQTCLSPGEKSHVNPDETESFQEKKINASDENKDLSKNQVDVASKDTSPLEYVACDIAPCFNTEPERLNESKPCSTDGNEFEEVQASTAAGGSKQAKLHEDSCQATTKSKMKAIEEKRNNLDLNDILADDHEFAVPSKETKMPNSVPEEVQTPEQVKSQIVKELEALNEANMRDSSFISDVTLYDKKDTMIMPSQSEMPASKDETDAMDTEQTMPVPNLDEPNASSRIDSTNLAQAAPTSRKDLKDSKDLELSSTFMNKEGEDQAHEPTLCGHVKLLGSEKDAGEPKFSHNFKSEPDLKEKLAPESNQGKPTSVKDMANEPEMSNQNITMTLIQSETSASQKSRMSKIVSLESGNQEEKGNLISKTQSQVNQPERDETSVHEARAATVDNLAEYDTVETSLPLQEPGHSADDNGTSLNHVLSEASSNDAIKEMHFDTYSQRSDDNPMHAISELQNIDFGPNQPTQVQEILDRTVQEKNKPHDRDFIEIERNEGSESKGSLDDKMHCIYTPDVLDSATSEKAALNLSQSPIPKVLHESDITGCHEGDGILHSNANEIDVTDSHVLDSSSREAHESSAPVHAKDNSFERNSSSLPQDAILAAKDFSSSKKDIPFTMEDISNPSNNSSSLEGVATATRDALSRMEDFLHPTQKASSVHDTPSTSATLSAMDSRLSHEGRAFRPGDFFTENDQHDAENALSSSLKDSTLEKNPTSMNASSIQENSFMPDETCLNNDITNECPSRAAFEHTSYVDSNTRLSVPSEKSIHLKSTTEPSLRADKGNLVELIPDTPSTPPTSADFPRDNPAFEVNSGYSSVDGQSENLQESLVTNTEPFKGTDTCKKSELPRVSSVLSDNEMARATKIGTTSQLKGLSSNTAERTSSTQHRAGSIPGTPRKLSLAERLQRATNASPASPVANSIGDKDTGSPFLGHDGDTTMLIRPACYDEKDSDQGPELVSNESTEDAMSQAKPSITSSNNDQPGSDAARVSGSHAIPEQDVDACDLQMSTELIQPYRKNTSGSIGETSHDSDSEHDSEGVPDLWVASENTPPKQEFFKRDTSFERNKMQDDSAAQNFLGASLVDLFTPTDSPRDCEGSMSPALNEQEALFTRNNLPALTTGPPSLLPKGSMSEENAIRSVSEATALSAHRKSPPLPQPSKDDRDMTRRTVSEAPSSLKDIRSTSKNKNHAPRRSLSDIMREANQILEEWK